MSAKNKMRSFPFLQEFSKVYLWGMPVPHWWWEQAEANHHNKIQIRTAKSFEVNQLYFFQLEMGKGLNIAFYIFPPIGILNVWKKIHEIVDGCWVEWLLRNQDFYTILLEAFYFSHFEGTNEIKSELQIKSQLIVPPKTCILRCVENFV